MLTKESGRFVYGCECCVATLDTDTKDFEEARRKLREAGWVAKKGPSDWEHICPDCQDK